MNDFSVAAGDLTKEEAVLKWVTAEDTLQIPNQIEEVNQRMLERILNTSDNVAVFFCESLMDFSHFLYLHVCKDNYYLS